MTLIELIICAFKAYLLAAGLIVFVAVVSIILKNLWPQARFTVAGWPLFLETPQDFRNQLHLLKRVSDKISEDRQLIEMTAFNVHRCDVEKLEQTPPSVRERNYASLKKISEQNLQADKILESLENLQNSFSTLKNELFCPNADDFSMVLSSATKTSSALDVKMSSGSQGNLNQDILIYILLVVKEYFSDFTSESMSERKKFTETVSRFLEQSQKNIKKDINKFCTAVTENDEHINANSFLLHKVGKIEKDLNETLTFFNRQRYNLEHLKKVLMCFKKTFGHFSSKFDTQWQQKEDVFEHLEEAKVLWTSVTEKINNTSHVLSQQSQNLAAMLLDMQNISQFWRQNARFLSSFSQLDGTPYEVTNESAVEWIQNAERVNEKLQSILSVSETSKENLNCLMQTTQNISNFSNLMDSVAAGYNTLLSVILSSLEKSRRAIREEPKNGERVRIAKSIDDINANLSGMAETRESFPFEDDCIWNEVRCELNDTKTHTEFQKLDIDKIILMLRDVIRQSVQLADEERTRSANGCVTNSVQNTQSQEMKRKLCLPPNPLKTCEEWAEFPSESSLNDVSADFLIENSEDSD